MKRKEGQEEREAGEEEEGETEEIRTSGKGKK